jgi:arginase family enzyme
MQQHRAKIRLIGLPTDSHSSFLRGPAQASAAIREALVSDHSNQAAESGLELGTDIIVEDAGDLPLTEGEADFDLIRNAASSIETTIFLGGDHMVSYPIVAGLASVHGPLNILHFDAHPDIYDDFEGDPLSHASPFARIM